MAARSNPPRVLAFDSVGHGSNPVVVLFHGWPLNRSVWSAVMSRVAAAGLRVLAPDLPGFGESPSIELGRERPAESPHAEDRDPHRFEGGILRAFSLFAVARLQGWDGGSHDFCSHRMNGLS